MNDEETTYSFSWMRPEAQRAIKSQDYIYINWGWLLVLASVIAGLSTIIYFLPDIIHMFSTVWEAVKLTKLK